MAQTVHLLDFQPMNFQQLSVIEASFLFPHNIESMLDEFMLPEGNHSTHLRRSPDGSVPGQKSIVPPKRSELSAPASVTLHDWVAALAQYSQNTS